MHKQNKNNHIRSHSFGGHLNKNWVNQDLRRYQLTYGSTLKTTPPKKGPDVDSLNNNNWLTLFNCLGLKKITLHASSGKLLSSPAMGAILDLAFTTIGGGLAPAKVYSRKSIAGFKLSKYSLLGVKATLRNIVKCEFYYKLYFLTAGDQNLKSRPPKSNVYWGGAPREDRLYRFRSSLNPTIEPYCTSKGLNLTGVTKKAASPFEQSKQALIQAARRAAVKQGFSVEGPMQSLPVSITSLAIKNVFRFNELDTLDYESFSSISGFEIHFSLKNPCFFGKKASF